MKINIDYDGPQRQAMDELVAIIKKIGDNTEVLETENFKNENNYIDCLNILMRIRQYILEGNRNYFIAATLKPDHEIVFYDKDEKLFRKIKLKDFDFVFGSDIPLSEAEINALNVQLRETGLTEKIGLKDTIVVDLGKYDGVIQEEEALMPKTKRERKVTQKELLMQRKQAEAEEKALKAAMANEGLQIPGLDWS